MRKLFGTDLTLSKPEHLKIIVAEVKEHQLGLIVDSVKDVIRVPPQSIHHPPRLVMNNLEAQFLTGVCKLQDELLMLLDVSKIMEENVLTDVLSISNEIPPSNN